MFSNFFNKRKQQRDPIAVLEKLNKTLELLEKKEDVLLKKVNAEKEKAIEFIRRKNKRAAAQCVNRKKLYEQQIEQLGNFQLRIHDQMIMLEGATVTAETVAALRTGADAMKIVQKATNIDDVDKTMDEISLQTDNMRMIQEAVSSPIGAASCFDEDELEAELEELEADELEEQLLQSGTTVPAVSVQPTRPVMSTSEVDELTALQAEMAL
ncbi:vacuolar protein sorting-associated protein 32 homolog 2-like [Vigna umbellata]|uniref:vacuolar protein sorting-associated protein 32 homolog 2-like n=1 Tax=Vigna umbellata TaxID=87088 RepID=UPI001F5EAE6C|nr:vacuolar protein sorting-associated protein 32 homolog 2-like [Vigna umbellata]